MTDTKDATAIPSTSEDTTTDVTLTSSEETEVKETPESSGDTDEEVAPRAIEKEVTESEEEEPESKSDPKESDTARRSYEVTRREVELGFTEGGAEYILDLDASNMSKERKSEVDAAVKHFWGNPTDGSKPVHNLEQAKKIINDAKDTPDDSEPSKLNNDVDINKLIDEKVEEKLRSKESTIETEKREVVEKEELAEFIDENDFLKKQNDPGDKNWDKFIETFRKFDKAGDAFTYKEKLAMSLEKAFNGEMDSSPSKNIGNAPVVGGSSVPKIVKGLKENPFLDILPADTIKNLEAAGKI